MIQRAIRQLNDAADLPVGISDFLQRRNHPRDIRALLCLFDGLRAFFHPFLNADPFAFKNGKRMLIQDANRQRTTIAFHCVHTGDAKGVRRFTKGAGISQDTIIAQNLRGFGNQIAVIKFLRVQHAPQFRRCQRKRKFLNRDDLLPQDRVKRKLHVVCNRWVFIFRQRPLNRHIFAESPTLQRIVSDDFNQSSERSASGLFAVVSVMKNLFDEDLLQGVN